MNEQARICQNCNQGFSLQPDDLVFYGKMDVPPPTFCPECRFQRRLMFRNERTLYKRQCDQCGKQMFSVYSSEELFVVYCISCHQSDAWDPLSFGREYDFNRPFFDQLRELQLSVPRANLWQRNSVHSDYSNFVQDVRNVYLSYSVIYSCENVFYSKNVDHSSLIFDSMDVTNSERCFDCVISEKNYSCNSVFISRGCMNSSFLYNCTNCTNCFMCVNLKSKTYCIENVQYSKEEYEGKLSAFRLSSYEQYTAILERFARFLLRYPHRYANNVNSPASTGDALRDCNGARFAFGAYALENVKYAFRSVYSKDAMDILNSGKNELVYEFSSGGADQSRMLRFVVNAGAGLSDITYADSCTNSAHLFGCVGLRNAEYCILNKRYAREEYDALVPRIIRQMNDVPYESFVRTAGSERGVIEYRFGEFFPVELSPFA